MLYIFLFFIALIFAVYKYYQWENSYWARRGIKSPPSRLYYGHWEDLILVKNPGPLQIANWTKEYGKVYGIYEGLRKILIVSDPDMLQELFQKKFEQFYGRKNHPLAPDAVKDPKMHVFNAEGSRWKRLRTLSVPSFSTNSLKKIHGTVEDSALSMVEFMKKHVDSGKGFNIHRFYQEYTMDVISRIAMGQDGCKMFENPLVDLVQKFFLTQMGNPVLYAVSGIPRFPRFLIEILRKSASNRKNVFLKIREIIQNTVDSRKESRRVKFEKGEELGDPIDFIDLFLDAEVPDIELSPDGIDRHTAKVDKHMTTDEIVAQCLVFILAGFDTTANSLAYASFLLAKHPNSVKRLQNELDEHCPGSDIPFDALHKLKYMECVVKESLRMYPLAAFASSRTCAEATTLGDIPIEKGVMIAADTFSVHFDKRIWGEDADEFRPERWEDGSARHPLAWFPFGAGPRQCIGMRLAYMEEKLALGHILKNYDIVEGAETEEILRGNPHSAVLLSSLCTTNPGTTFSRFPPLPPGDKETCLRAGLSEGRRGHTRPGSYKASGSAVRKQNQFGF